MERKREREKPLQLHLAVEVLSSWHRGSNESDTSRQLRPRPVNEVPRLNNHEGGGGAAPSMSTRSLNPGPSTRDPET